MLLQEARDHVGPERKRDAAVVFAPAGDIFVWVGPEQIAEKTAIRDLDRSACTIETLAVTQRQFQDAKRAN